MSETTFAPSDVAQWRDWLTRHAQSEKEIWLVVEHKDSDAPSPRYHEAIEQALCFGWIDGLHRKHTDHSSRLRFTPRRPSSSWSAVNRERAERMSEQGLMTEQGQALIDLAKASGTWQVVPSDVSAVPDDLRDALRSNDPAGKHFDAFPPSSRRLILEWIVTAKKPETRRRRIDRTVELAAVGLRANQPGARSKPVG
jgi:uncharacterized protein YdeI (YjbR/CyaY-like superfamily)